MAGRLVTKLGPRSSVLPIAGARGHVECVWEVVRGLMAAGTALLGRVNANGWTPEYLARRFHRPACADFIAYLASNAGATMELARVAGALQRQLAASLRVRARVMS